MNKAQAIKIATDNVDAVAQRACTLEDKQSYHTKVNTVYYNEKGKRRDGKNVFYLSASYKGEGDESPISKDKDNEQLDSYYTEHLAELWLDATAGVAVEDIANKHPAVELDKIKNICQLAQMPAKDFIKTYGGGIKSMASKVACSFRTIEGWSQGRATMPPVVRFLCCKFFGLI